jgi:hypothetical protein
VHLNATIALYNDTLRSQKIVKLGGMKVGGYHRANIGRALMALIIIKGSLLMGYKWDKPKTFISRKETANELLLRNRPSFKTIDPMRN